MAKDIEIKCAYCTAKEDFVDYKAATSAGWEIFGWHMNTNTPYAKCPKCSEGLVSDREVPDEKSSEDKPKRRKRAEKDTEAPPPKKRGRPRKVKE